MQEAVYVTDAQFALDRLKLYLTVLAPIKNSDPLLEVQITAIQNIVEQTEADVANGRDLDEAWEEYFFAEIDFIVDRIRDTMDQRDDETNAAYVYVRDFLLAIKYTQ